MKINELEISQLNPEWLLSFIKREFNREGINITPLRILEKLGIPIKDQEGQLKYKSFRIKIKDLLARLSGDGYLVIQSGKHDTLGIKEDYYKLKT